MNRIKLLVYDMGYLLVYAITGTINLLRYGFYVLSVWVISQDFIKVIDCVANKTFNDELKKSSLNLILFAILVVANYAFGKFNYRPYEKAKEWLGFSGFFDDEEKTIENKQVVNERRYFREEKKDNEKEIVEKERRIKSETILSSDELDSFTKKGSLNPEVELNSMIGLNDVKEQIQYLFARMQFNKINKRSEKSNMHMCFTGSAGTGKTHIARIVTGYLYQLGYIKNNELIEISSTQLMGVYLGQTKERTTRFVKRAVDKGCVLFIDEIYALKSNNNNQYAEEAIAVLLKAMEDYKDKFILIVAGYKDETEWFLSQNQGLHSRISTYVDFPNYSSEECAEILELKIRKEYKLTMDPQLKDYYKKYVEKLVSISDYNKQHNIAGYRFGNARTVEQDASSLYSCHCLNYSKKNLKADEKKVITMKDISLLEKNLISIKEEK